MKISYISRLPRMLIAVLIGVLMVYVSELKDWSTLHEHRGYPRALAISVSISLVLGEIVHWLTVWLDRWAGWFERPILRTVLQFGLGIILPLVMAFAAMFIFYDSNGYTFSQTTYLDQVIVPVGLLLLVTNLYYFGQVLFADRQLAIGRKLELENLERGRREKFQAEQAAKAEVLRLARLKFKLTSNQEIKEIMMIVSINRDLFLYTHLTSRQPWTTTIRDTIALLPKDEFFQISKSCIISRDNIICAYQGSSSTIELELKFPSGGFATVSQRTVPNFIIWYDQPIFPPRTDQGSSPELD
jgi:hypothetical protein